MGLNLCSELWYPRALVGGFKQSRNQRDSLGFDRQVAGRTWSIVSPLCLIRDEFQEKKLAIESIHMENGLLSPWCVCIRSRIGRSDYGSNRCVLPGG